MINMKIEAVGDKAVMVIFGDVVSEEINGQVTSFAGVILDSGKEGVVDVIPTFTSVLINYDPLILPYTELENFCRSSVSGMKEGEKRQRRIFEIPVLYGGKRGEDLPYVAERAGMTEDEVIRVHSSVDYLIYMLGFMPGFVYLGGLDPRLVTPRLKRPRLAIPKGSVGIGGEATGIYPTVSPGGWQLIGNTPVDVYDPKREPAILYEAGDRIRFVPVDEPEYEKIKAKVLERSYDVIVFMEED